MKKGLNQNPEPKNPLSFRHPVSGSEVESNGWSKCCKWRVVQLWLQKKLGYLVMIGEERYLLIFDRKSRWGFFGRVKYYLTSVGAESLQHKFISALQPKFSSHSAASLPVAGSLVCRVVCAAFETARSETSVRKTKAESPWRL